MLSRLKEIENLGTEREVDRMDLIDLIDWSGVSGVLDDDHRKIAHKIRKFRNYLVHPKEDYSKIAKEYPWMKADMRKTKLVYEGKKKLTEKEIIRFKSMSSFLMGRKRLAKEILCDVAKYSLRLNNEFLFLNLILLYLYIPSSVTPLIPALAFTIVFLPARIERVEANQAGVSTVPASPFSGRVPIIQI